MTDEGLRPLTNDGWGFPSNCFVCEARNDAGLRIPFFHDPSDDSVVARFTLDERFSGAPRYVHGGVALAILDEAMAWATIAIAGTFAVTTETTSRFDRPVRVGRGHTVRARIVGVEGRTIATSSQITRDDGTPCVAATASFTGLDLDQAGDATGSSGADVEAHTLRSRSS